FQQPVVPQIGQSYAGTCNNMVQFTDNSIICTTVSIVSRTWDFGDGTTSTQLNPSHNYTANGTYVVKLTLNDDQGGVNVRTSSVSVMVNPPVPALGNDIDVCPGTPVTLNAGTTGGIYKWFPAGLTSDSTSPTLTFIPTGDMNVKLSVTGCNQTGWDSIRIYVRNNTKPTLTMVGKALQSSAANSYNWFVNSTLIPSATNKMYTPKQPGYYQVGTINDYLCPSLSDSVFYMPTGRFKAGEVIIRLSPNPTKGVFTVWLSKAPTKPVRMEIFTADGKLAYNTLINSQVSTIYPGHLTKGAYMVRFIINGSVETVPLIEL
ncbi:MAG TPA: PKD domain-containing protein, partial [Flavitalea sp.]|nr:PKD domain-containing protein [Flavitalea sp.]